MGGKNLEKPIPEGIKPPEEVKEVVIEKKVRRKRRARRKAKRSSDFFEKMFVPMKVEDLISFYKIIDRRSTKRKLKKIILSKLNLS
jgi:hypothetical protein